MRTEIRFVAGKIPDAGIKIGKIEMESKRRQRLRSVPPITDELGLGLEGADSQLTLFTGVEEAVQDDRPPVRDERPETLPSKTYKVKVSFEGNTVNLYITITDDENGRPFDVFLNCSYGALTDYLQTVGPLMSRMLRYGIAPEAIAKDLVDVHSPFTQHWQKGWHCPSLSALIGCVLLAHARGEDLDSMQRNITPA